MVKVLCLPFFALLLTTSFAYPLKPAVNISPGHVCTTSNPDFQKFRYDEQIPYCKRHVKWETKAEVLSDYNIPLSDRKQYIIDHIIPLSIGGSNHQNNLWPEHLTVKKRLGTIEDDVFLSVRDGVISQKEAIRIIMDAKFWEGVSLDHLTF